MSRSPLLFTLACAFLLGCWGGDRTRPETPTPARAPFSPGLPIPPVQRERPRPPPAPPDALAGSPEGQLPFEEETAPDSDPPAGQLDDPEDPPPPP